MTTDSHEETRDLADASKASVEIYILQDDLARACRLIEENEWGQEEGLLNIFVSGLYYLLGERRLQAIGSDHASATEEMERLIKDLMLYQSMYSVMKYRAFTLGEEKYVLEGNVSGLRAADRFSNERLKIFRRDEEMLRARLAELEEENSRLRQVSDLNERPVRLERNVVKAGKRS